MDLTKDEQAVERIKTWLRISVCKSLFLDVFITHYLFQRLCID